MCSQSRKKTGTDDTAIMELCKYSHQWFQGTQLEGLTRKKGYLDQIEWYISRCVSGRFR